MSGEGEKEKTLPYILKAVLFSAQKLQQHHPSIKALEVAQILANEAHVTDLCTLVSSLLYTTLLDIDSVSEIAYHFGADVADVVSQVSEEDKSVSQKQFQVEHIATLRREALVVKMADTLYSMRRLLQNVPLSWDAETVQQYFVWSYYLVGEIRGINEYLERSIRTLFASEFILHGFRYPTIPNSKPLSQLLQDYYSNPTLPTPDFPER